MQYTQYTELFQSGNVELHDLTSAVISINEFIGAEQFILLIVLSDRAAQEGLSVCITSHLLGHNVETEPLHYLALHGCPPSCARSALSPLAQEGRQCRKVYSAVCGGHSRGPSQPIELTYILYIR